MKKIILTMVVAAFGAVAVNAQEIPERKTDKFTPRHHERGYGKKEMADLELTEDQKAKLKTLNQEHRQQVEALQKMDNITVKESREKMEELRKDHKSKMQALLTPEQKAKMEKNKEARAAKTKDYGKKRMEKMKEELNLTDDQVAKLTESRSKMAEKMKAVREDKSLTDEQKKEKTKEIMKEQEKTMKSVLTEEQMKKRKESRMHHRHGEKKEMNK